MYKVLKLMMSKMAKFWQFFNLDPRASPLLRMLDDEDAHA